MKKNKVQKYSPNKALAFGHKYQKPNSNYYYHSGGAGYAISRRGVQRIVRDGLLGGNCSAEAKVVTEDVFVGKCLSKLGAAVMDGADENGAHRFFPVAVWDYLHQYRLPPWLNKTSVTKLKPSYSCCSPHFMAMNYAANNLEYLADYLLHRLRPFDIDLFQFVFNRIAVGNASSQTREQGGAEHGPESWDELTYQKPEKLKVPCARVDSDSEWYEIDRVLDTICLVGCDKGWQSLVQWKPQWSKQIHTQSALKDFQGRATVLGCVIRNDVLRSRIRHKIEWNRKEFMSCNFRVRIEHPDGSTTSEVMPYPDVKRRFPAALFEFMESRMSMPRVPEKDEPRPDGLLPVYNRINIPRCLPLSRRKSMKEKTTMEPASAVTQSAADPLENDLERSVNSSDTAAQEGLPNLERSVRKKRAKDSRKTFGGSRRSRLVRKRLSERKQLALSKLDDSAASDASIQTAIDSLRSSECQVKICSVVGVSLRQGEEFLRLLLSSHYAVLDDAATKPRKSVTPLVPLRSRVSPRNSTASERRSGQSKVDSEPSVINGDENLPDVITVENKSNEVTNKANDVARVRRKSVSEGVLKDISSPKKVSDAIIVSPMENKERRSRTFIISPRGDSATHLKKNEFENSKSPPGKVILSPVNADGKKSHQKTKSAKRRRRSSTETKQPSSKRFTPVRQRNSLDNYFTRSASRPREALGNVTIQQNIMC
ncbi:unnamed protein product [Nippostrongylus brasiliensis]|uniref:Uncharacterized protein n=1 Tax=Nippostrongylus brasiliensis TaxID=27835 RepID=A0A0N4YNS2_NIPBR|nr:unnamed protein product [Nippostrongylus brasiliensis]